MTVYENITGILLAGGESKRMGRPKAGIKLGGRSLLQRALDPLLQICGTTMLVTRTPLEFADLDIQLVRDLVPGEGPLGGLATGLFHANTPWAMVVACDLPFLRPEVMEHLAAMTVNAPSGPRAFVPRTEGGWQPLAAVYSTECLKPAQALLSLGGRKVDDVRHHGVAWHSIPAEEFVPMDDTLQSFINLNTPEDLADAKNRIENPSDGKEKYRG